MGVTLVGIWDLYYKKRDMIAMRLGYLMEMKRKKIRAYLGVCVWIILKIGKEPDTICSTVPLFRVGS